MPVVVTGVLVCVLVRKRVYHVCVCLFVNLCVHVFVHTYVNMCLYVYTCTYACDNGIGAVREKAVDADGYRGVQWDQGAAWLRVPGGVTGPTHLISIQELWDWQCGSSCVHSLFGSMLCG